MISMQLLASTSIEGLLVFVAIMLLSGVSNWLKKRHGHAEENPLDQGPRPPAAPRRPVPTGKPARTPSPRPASAWEEELRRLLGDEPLVPPPAAPGPLPPPVVAQTAAPPPPLKTPTPAPVPSPARHPAPTPLPVPTSSPVRFPEEREALDRAEAPSFELAPLQQAAQAYQRASQLDTKADARMHEVAAQTQRAASAQPKPRRPAGSWEARQVVGQLRHPRAARQAIVASMILGPPKALEH